MSVVSCPNMPWSNKLEPRAYFTCIALRNARTVNYECFLLLGEESKDICPLDRGSHPKIDLVWLRRTRTWYHTHTHTHTHCLHAAGSIWDRFWPLTGFKPNISPLAIVQSNSRYTNSPPKTAEYFLYTRNKSNTYRHTTRHDTTRHDSTNFPQIYLR